MSHRHKLHKWIVSNSRSLRFLPSMSDQLSAGEQFQIGFAQAAAGELGSCWVYCYCGGVCVHVGVPAAHCCTTRVICNIIGISPLACFLNSVCMHLRSQFYTHIFKYFASIVTLELLHLCLHSLSHVLRKND